MIFNCRLSQSVDNHSPGGGLSLKSIELPKELFLKHILHELSVKDFYRCKRVCRVWKMICEDPSSEILKFMVQRDFPTKNFPFENFKISSFLDVQDIYENGSAFGFFKKETFTRQDLYKPTETYLNPKPTWFGKLRSFFPYLRRNSGDADCRLQISLDGKNVALGSEKGHVDVWDIEKSFLRSVVNSHTEAVSALFLRGELVISGSDDCTIQVSNWHLNQQWLLKGHTAGINSVALKGEYLASGSKDYTVRIWKWASSECTVLNGHTASVNCVTFQSERFVISGSDDCTVRIWDWKNQECLSVSNKNAFVTSLAVQGRLVVYGTSNGYVELVNWQKSPLLIPKRIIKNPISSLFFVGDVIVLFTRGENKVMFWNWVNDEVLGGFSCDAHSPITAISLEQRSLVFLIGNDQQRVSLFDLEDVATI